MSTCGEDGVLIVEINRPKQRNCVNPETASELYRSVPCSYIGIAHGVCISPLIWKFSSYFDAVCHNIVHCNATFDQIITFPFCPLSPMDVKVRRILQSYTLTLLDC